LLAKKNMIMIGVAAAIAIGFAAYAIASQDMTKQDFEQSDSGEMQGPSPTPEENAVVYKINTECELIYAIAYGQYPDGEALYDVKVEVLLANYPEEFEPWKDELQNIENRTAFFAKPLPDEFRNVLTPALMKEAGISPHLEQIARIISDEKGEEKLQQAYQGFGCQKYFEERQK
jgi:hypothetical protein